MSQRHLVVIPKTSGGVEVYPLKEWLRSNPEQLPSDMTTRNTSHTLRAGLKKLGWKRQDTEDEVRLFPPSSGDDISRVIDVLGDAEDEEEEIDESGETTFSLEYQLRDFIASNMESIDIGGKKLRVYVDELERDGVEYQTGVGRIDILAVDENDNFYVFELKRASSPDKAFGQVARYMGWLRNTIGKNRNVYGVIVSKTVSRNLRFAKTITPDVFLYEYEVSFALQEAHGLDE